MKKFKLASLIGAVALIANAYITPAMAISVGGGVSFGAAHIEATGTETLRGDANSSAVKQSAHEDTQAVLSSAYAQIIVGESVFGDGNGFAIGYEHIFGEGSFKGQGQIETQEYGVAQAFDIGAQNVEVVVSNINTMFVETPGFTPVGIYLKAGYSEMDLETKEDLITGGEYGNSSTDGMVYGFGFKQAANGWQFKTEFTYTDWDTLTVSNTTDSTGTSTISATPEQWGAKMGIGYSF